MDLQYENYFKAMPCYLTVQDRNLRIIDANQRFINDFGDYDGRYCYQVYKHRSEKCEVCPVERTFHDGQRHGSEETVRSLSGEDVSVIVYTTPIRSDDGKIVAVMEMSTDITQIKLLQDQLRESQQRYQLLFDQVPCYISIQDQDLNIIEANRKFRDDFGSYLGCKCHEVYKHRSEECLPCPVQASFSDGTVHQSEEVVTSQSGELVNVLVQTAPILDTHGKIQSVMEMSTNITEIRALQDQLTNLGLLISSLSHTIKGILSGMDSGIYMMNSGFERKNQSRIDKGWEIVRRNSRLIKNTMLDILYYSKERELEIVEIDSAELCTEVEELIKAKASENGIHWESELDQATGKFNADYAAMRTMLINLLENTIDACRADNKKDGHRITVACNGDKDNVVFEVSDNGVGMDRETREKAFSLFFSGKGTQGTGLGLFMANQIAAKHGGKINLKSELGVGTCFTVSFPRKQLEVSEQLQIQTP